MPTSRSRNAAIPPMATAYSPFQMAIPAKAIDGPLYVVTRSVTYGRHCIGKSLA
jgi:hypothetical protein